MGDVTKNRQIVADTAGDAKTPASDEQAGVQPGSLLTTQLQRTTVALQSVEQLEGGCIQFTGSLRVAGAPKYWTLQGASQSGYGRQEFRIPNSLV